MAYFREETSRLTVLQKAGLAGAVKRYVLRGRVVTMNAAHDVIPDGFVCVADETIVHVGAWSDGLPAPFDAAKLIVTGGSIYPGLIELHNHPSYNFIPMWPVVQHFDNRGIWRNDPGYKRWVSNTDYLLCNHPVATYPKALVRFVECRAILGGVTTTQGILYQNGSAMRSYYDGLVRNVEFPVKNWPVADDYINDFTSAQDAENRAGPALAAGTPYIIHLCEGVDATTRAKFDYLQKGDGTWLIGPSLVTIHGVALDDPQFRTLAQNRVGGLVWSPLSNMLLYGATTKVARAKAAGVPIAIGCDWAPSGTKNLLGELKIAKIVSDHEGGIFSDRELVDAVTRTPAAMLGWAPYVGSIQADRTADLMIIDTAGGDPYRELIDADESNIIAVIIDGRPRAGRATLIDPGSADAELIRIAQQNLVLDIIESKTHPLGGTSLSSAIATMTYALANLKDVAREAHTLAPMMEGVVDHWRPVPDYDDRPAGPMFAAPTLPGPDDVDPLAIEPMTAVDDTGFIGRIQANPNVPQWLKDSL
ncbi:amidohydrolase family protein [Bradyrhizobium sp. PSBB068]|nr:amidohydrolase family protein [Bradyrhizobium sp. PSBB068]